MESEKIVGFAAVSHRDLLVIFLDNPRRKVVVQSAEARRLYDRPVDKKPGYVLNRDHSEGRFTIRWRHPALQPATRGTSVAAFGGAFPFPVPDPRAVRPVGAQTPEGRLHLLRPHYAPKFHNAE